MLSNVPFLIDAHLDLATNAVHLNRDLRQSVHEIRARERELGQTDYPDRGNGTVAFPELRRGGIGLVWGTLIARYAARGTPAPANLALPGWQSPEQAYAAARGQLTWYREMERVGELTPITTRAQLDTHTQRYQHRKEGGDVTDRLRHGSGGGGLHRHPRSPAYLLRGGPAVDRSGALRSGAVRGRYSVGRQRADGGGAGATTRDESA